MRRGAAPEASVEQQCRYNYGGRDSRRKEKSFPGIPHGFTFRRYSLTRGRRALSPWRDLLRVHSDCWNAERQIHFARARSKSYLDEQQLKRLKSEG